MKHFITNMNTNDGGLFVGDPKKFQPTKSGVIEDWDGDIAHVRGENNEIIAALIAFNKRNFTIDADVDKNGVINSITVTATGDTIDNVEFEEDGDVETLVIDAD